MEVHTSQSPASGVLYPTNHAGKLNILGPALLPFPAVRLSVPLALPHIKDGGAGAGEGMVGVGVGQSQWLL